MVKSYSPFLEITRKDEHPEFAEIFLINVDQIVAVRCLNDGSARVYVQADPFMSQWIDPIENYNFFVTALTELTATSQPVDEDDGVG